MIEIFLPVSYNKRNGPLTKVHSYVSSFLDKRKFRVYMFRSDEKDTPEHIKLIKIPSFGSKKIEKNIIHDSMSFLSEIVRQVDILHIVIYTEIFPLFAIRKFFALITFLADR